MSIPPCIGQSELGAHNPARGGRGPVAPSGPSALRGSESAKVGDLHSAGPSAGGAALRAAPPGSAAGG
eukprot:10361055-Alexandrium_andersonii.AAC.1